MINQLQRHFVIACRTHQRVFTEAVEEPLLKRFGWQDPVPSGRLRRAGREDLAKDFSHFLVSNISMQSVITDSLKTLWQDVLHHSSDESQDRESFMLNLPCGVVPIPIADRLSIVPFNSSNGDRRRYDILCQILRQSLSAGRHVSRLKKGDKAFGIVSPGPIDVSFNGRIGDLFSEHFQQMILPFSVHHAVGDIRDILPLFQGINSTCGHEDMKVGIVMAGASRGLEDDNISTIERDAGAGVENIFETGIPCPHERTEQCRIAKEPGSKELRQGQDHMAVRDTGQQPSSDEIGPAVGIDFGTRQAKAGLAGEGNAAYFSTVAASVLNKAHLVGIAAVKHFLEGVVVLRAVKSWMSLLKRIPMIGENPLERVFVNAFHGCSLRTTITEMAKRVERRVENVLC